MSGVWVQGQKAATAGGSSGVWAFFNGLARAIRASRIPGKGRMAKSTACRVQPINKEE